MSALDEKFKTLAEPFRIKMVEPIKLTTASYRKKRLKEAGYNPFLLDSEDVYIDLLTDSGTGAMSQYQWAGMMVGDESYAGSKSWKLLEKVVKELSGMPYVLPTHQGRAGERILYGILGGKKKTFLSNTHFDTTRANIEHTGATAIDLMPEDALDPDKYLPFKGNIDLKKLDAKIKEIGASNIGGVVLTVTNNSSGGQPVSMENAEKVRSICNKHKVLMIIDGCRVAENSYFIKHREKEYAELSYKQIAQKMLRLADAFVMSAKKDGMVNMGGLLCMKNKSLKTKCVNQLIISEGYTTYGGLSGRDMHAMAIGLEEVFDSDYLHYRIRSTFYLGNHLREKGIPVIWPIGGHAVYIDAKKLYPNIPVEEFPGQVLVCELYEKGGVRSVEIGSVMFGKYDQDKNLIPAPQELVRLAIPRRMYTQSHIDYVIEVFDEILKNKSKNRGFEVTWEPKELRHFTIQLKKLK